MNAKRSAQFGGLLKSGLNSIAALEGKTAPAVDNEIGGLVGLAGTSLQRYRSGHIPADGRLIATCATACVKRGLMSREWLEQFLRAAGYPPNESHALVAELFPPTQPSARAPSARSNLPPATFAHYVMRRAAYDAVIKGLRGPLPLTVITSMGGMGKTSLARVVAGTCLESHAAPAFASAVWVSDQARPGSTTLSSFLDEVARVLDYPGLAALPFAEKAREVERLLRGQSTLLVLDNAESVRDTALLEWIARLPAPSKAIVTTRNTSPAFQQAWHVELEPLDTAQAHELIQSRSVQRGLHNLPDATRQLEPLVQATGGNPKALEVALGLMQRERRPLPEVVAQLAGADIEELFASLFESAWATLAAPGRQALMALTLFPGSAAEAALAACLALPARAFQRTIGQLADLSLLDIEQPDLMAAPRYALHPLVRAFATAQLTRRPQEGDALRERWLAWCVDLAASVGFCWDDLDRLDRLDHEHEAVQDALGWAAASGRDEATVRLAEGVRYYYNVRGLWDDRRTANYELRAAAARRLGDASELVLALTQHAEVLSKQSTLAAASALFDQAEAAAAGAQLSDDAAFELGHARALLARARGCLLEAEQHWRDLLPFAAVLGGQKYVINRRWLAGCLWEQGCVSEAAALYRASLADAEACNDTRSVTGNSLRLAAIDLDHGELDSAAAALDRSRRVAERHQDRRRLAECYQLSARLCAARGDGAKAAALREEAANLFERMGMRREAEALQVEHSVV